MSILDQQQERLNFDLDKFYDKEYTFRCYEENLRFLKDEYFRASVVGKHNIPFCEAEKRPVIFVGNHSGMGLSWDNITFDMALYDLLKDHYNGDVNKALNQKLRRLVSPNLIEDNKVIPFDIPNWWRRLRCAPINMETFEQAMQAGGFIYVSPEGVPGIAKGFNNRYRLQPYSSSFLLMAKKYNALVIPISIVNAEYLAPFNYKIDLVNQVLGKIGYPFFPVGPAWAQLAFPATYLTAAPAKLTYVIHEPIEYEATEVLDREGLKEEAKKFREKHQKLLDESVELFHQPYDLKSLFSSFKRSKKKKMYLPFFWHEMFLKTEGMPSYGQALYKVPVGFPLVKAYRWWFDKTNNT